MKTSIAASIAILVGYSASSMAAVGPIVFDRDGTGTSDPIIVTTMNWGNNTGLMHELINQVKALGVVGDATLNSSWDFFAQASLSSMDSLNGTDNCVLGVCTLVGAQHHITFELGLNMSTLATSDTAAGILNAEQSGAGTNYFRIYFDPSTAPAGSNPNAGAGTGYGPISGPAVDGGRIEILSGLIVDADLTFSMTGQDSSDRRKQDNFGGDDRTGVGTYVGNGSLQFQIEVLTQDFDFFVSDIRNTVVDIGTILSSQNSTPFGQVNPALSVQANTPDYGDDTVTGPFTSTGDPTGTAPARVMDDFRCISDGARPGAVADAGGDRSRTCDLSVQTVFTQSFNNPVPVPEPATLSILGLGISAAGLSMVSRRNRRRNAA